MPVAIGKDTMFVKRATCRKCGTIQEYWPNEVFPLYRTTDYGGGPAGADGFHCVSCGEHVITKQW